MTSLEFRSDVSMQDGGVANIVSFYLTQEGHDTPPNYRPARAVGYHMLPFNDSLRKGSAPKKGLRVDFDPRMALCEPIHLLTFGSDPLQCNIVLDERVDPVHCKLYAQLNSGPDMWIVKDTSTLGTYIRDESCENLVRRSSRAAKGLREIKVGPYEFKCYQPTDKLEIKERSQWFRRHEPLPVTAKILKAQLLDQVAEWKPLGMIAKGSFGRVFKVMEEQTGLMAAIKTQLPFLVEHLDSFSGIYAGRIHWEVIMPLFRGDLMEALPNMRLSVRERAMTQIVTGLDYMHSQGLVHCDIKPTNIFIREATPLNIVIGDLGLASTMDHLRKDSGTKGFMAPECFLEDSVAKLTPAIDIFALGRTFHLILDFERVKEQNFIFSKTHDRPPHYPFLVQQMTEDKPEDRPALQQVQQLLHERKDFTALSPTTAPAMREPSLLHAPITNPRRVKALHSHNLAASLANKPVLNARLVQPARYGMSKQQTPLYQGGAGALDFARKARGCPQIMPQNIKLFPPMRQARRNMVEARRELSPVQEESVKLRCEKKVNFNMPVVEPENIFGGHNIEKASGQLKGQDNCTSTQKTVRSCMKSNTKSTQLSMREAGKFTICDSIQLHKVRRQGCKVSRKPLRKRNSIWRNLKTIAGGVADLAIDIADVGQDVLSWIQKSLGCQIAAVAVDQKAA